MRPVIKIIACTILLSYLGTPLYSQLPGSPDEDFGVNGTVLTDFDENFNSATKILVQDDEKILVCGFSGYTLANQNANLVRYMPDGSYDLSFGNSGKISFSLGGPVSQAFDMTVQTDGKILVTGYASDGPTNDISTARFLETGAPDPSFGTNGIRTTDLGHDEYGHGITSQDDGKILVTGYIDYGPGTDINVFICRYNSDGSTDTGFGTNGHVTTELNQGSQDMPGDICIHQDKILISAIAYNGNSTAYDAIALARYNMDGSLDASFGVDGISLYDGLTIDNGFLSPGAAMDTDHDDRIVIASHIHGLEGKDFAIYRFEPGGYPDNDFNGDGMLVIDMIRDNAARAITVQPDGKILCGGYRDNGNDHDFTTARCLEDGSLDPLFGNQKGVSVLDISQGAYYMDEINTITMQPDGKMLLAGTADNADGNRDMAVVRCHSGLPAGIHDDLPQNTSFKIFPNPVTTRVCYCKLNIPTRGNVHIALFDQEMKAIITLLNLTLPEGHHTLKLNLPEDLSGSMHFIRVRAPGTDKTEKIRIHAF